MGGDIKEVGWEDVDLIHLAYGAGGNLWAL
jgi:hypothetical protein